MSRFLWIWLGQLISLTGSSLTSFGLGVWVYRQTGSVTQLALIPLLQYLPGILILPWAGIWVDRWSRRWAMILSDTGAGLSTLAIAFVFLDPQPPLAVIYAAIALTSVFSAFQWTAYAAAIPQLISKSKLGQANGLIELAKASAKLLAPPLAGWLLFQIQLQGILLIDICTFSCSLLILILVRWPQYPHPLESSDGQSKKPIVLQDFLTTFHYIQTDPVLRTLLRWMAFLYFLLGILEVLFTPLILSMAPPQTLGWVLSLGGLGWLLGSALMSLWGGPKNPLQGVFGFAAFQSCWLLLGGLRPSVAIAAIGIFGYLFSYPFIASCAQSIWQQRVPLHLQGRVFSMRLFWEWLALPLGYAVAGPLSDRLFEPLLQPQGGLANSLGLVLGTGPGRGIGLLFMILGVMTFLGVILAQQGLRQKA